jgi:hypothetical protein
VIQVRDKQFDLQLLRLAQLIERAQQRYRIGATRNGNYDASVRRRQPQPSPLFHKRPRKDRDPDAAPSSRRTCPDSTRFSCFSAVGHAVRPDSSIALWRRLNSNSFVAQPPLANAAGQT